MARMCCRWQANTRSKSSRAVSCNFFRTKRRMFGSIGVTRGSTRPLTGVQSALFNDSDAVLLIMKNGYTSATGTQEIISTPDETLREQASDKHESLVDRNRTIEETLKGIGVKWLRTVGSYRVDDMRRTLIEAFTTDARGLKVVIAGGECELE